MWFIVGLALAAPEEFEVCGSFGTTEGPLEVQVDQDLVGEIQSSGLAASRTEEGLYYTHDDAGGEPRLYLFRDTGPGGEFVGPQLVSGATNTDWEDLAAGPCPGSVDAEHCIWIADIGDNDEVRPNVSVWVVPESTQANVTAVECALVYPEGEKHDAEALLISPDGTLRILTKDKDGAKVFRIGNPDCDNGAAQTLTEEAEIPEAVSVTGAAMSPDGTAVVIRNLEQAWLWNGCSLDWNTAPIPLDLGSQPQGEAVAFALDGSLLATTEVSGDEPLRYWRTPCAETTTIQCETCGCDGGGAALLLLPLAGLVRRRRERT